MREHTEYTWLSVFSVPLVIYLRNLGWIQSDLMMLKSFKLVIEISVALWLDVTNCLYNSGSFLTHPGKAPGLRTEATAGASVQQML